MWNLIRSSWSTGLAHLDLCIKMMHDCNGHLFPELRITDFSVEVILIVFVKARESSLHHLDVYVLNRLIAGVCVYIHPQTRSSSLFLALLGIPDISLRFDLPHCCTPSVLRAAVLLIAPVSIHLEVRTNEHKLTDQ